MQYFRCLCLIFLTSSATSASSPMISALFEAILEAFGCWVTILSADIAWRVFPPILDAIRSTSIACDDFQSLLSCPKRFYWLFKGCVALSLNECDFCVKFIGKRHHQDRHHVTITNK